MIFSGKGVVEEDVIRDVDEMIIYSSSDCLTSLIKELKVVLDDYRFRKDSNQTSEGYYHGRIGLHSNNDEDFSTVFVLELFF